MHNHQAGDTIFEVLNLEGIEANKFILFGNFGNEQAELLRVASINTSNNTFTLASPVSYPHAESTRVSVIAYDTIRFFHTSTAFYSDTSPLSNWVNLQPNNWFTTFDDTVNSTGYGWFVFRDSVSLIASQPSNAIPYTGFDRNTVKSLFDDFLSLLNNKELKLVGPAEMYSWANEGYSLIRNKLNLANVEYTASESMSLPIVSGIAEYALPSGFSDLISIVDSTGPGTPFGPCAIEFINLREAASYWGNKTRYYIRGAYIGFVPTPTSAATYAYRYLQKGSNLTSYDDIIDLPDNGYYMVKDWMLYRAMLKFTNPMFKEYKQNFMDGLNMLIPSAIKRDANLDTWGIDPRANV